LKKVKYFIKLIRIHQILKAFFIFIPLVFSRKFLNPELDLYATIVFIAFFLLSGIVYIVNDINDIEEDKLHPKKKFRPLAAGNLTLKEAYIGLSIITLFFLVSVIFIYLINPTVLLILALYLINNLLYSKFLKRIPVLDLLSVSAGFVLRILAGALIINEQLSGFLLLAVICLTLLIISIKRYRELIIYGTKARTVLKYYSKDFLGGLISLFFIAFVCIYLLFTIIDKKSNLALIFSNIPIFILTLNFARQVFTLKDREDDPFKLFLLEKLNVILALTWLVIVLYSLLK